ncbi:hypothetical protein DMA12_28895 [Amycolatopsis balhimycina DSM 5908]|uniref:HAF repeat-containing protein n=1 Tax=Amycolatopsis balhimycina DSM 5908 TaxID=1081091 RepID=A0A428W9T6_AMYBA|nr:hypothetical protein [Amycolatopsis balhimycina]RSM39866.1 hypothetical protein DMA12_28895 [Amycolatopsis balhimycina DSM 5908]
MKVNSVKRVAAVVAAAAITATAAPAAEAAGLGHWRAEFLATPEGYPDATGFVRGNDSHGGYAGNLVLGEASVFVTWSAGRPAVHPLPDGMAHFTVADENSAGTVLGSITDAGFRYQVALFGHGGFRVLPRPADRPLVSAVALNERGDAIARATASDGSDPAVLLWRADDVEHPVVITGMPYLQAADIDDDGTVLVNSFPGSYLWRDGEFRQLTAPPEAAYLYAQAIRNGQVVGNYGTADQLHGEAVRWRSPEQPEILPSSSSGWGINRYGLVVGYGARPDPFGPLGPLSVWLNGRALGPLPLPPGFSLGGAKAVGDDGTIAGVVSNQDPTMYGGRPVVWRYSLR